MTAYGVVREKELRQNYSILDQNYLELNKSIHFFHKNLCEQIWWQIGKTCIDTQCKHADAHLGWRTFRAYRDEILTSQLNDISE